MALIFLSFANMSNPKKAQHLGCCFVHAPDIASGTTRATQLNIHPGTKQPCIVAGIVLADDAPIGDADKDCLLSATDLKGVVPAGNVQALADKYPINA